MSCPYGDAVVHVISDTIFGFPDYILKLLETGEYKTCHKHELRPIEGLDDMCDEAFVSDVFDMDMRDMEFEMDCEEDSFQQLPTISPPKKRFAKLESHIDLENLADQRNSKNTNNQTRWAVKIFKGKLYFYYLK